MSEPRVLLAERLKALTAQIVEQVDTSHADATQRSARPLKLLSSARAAFECGDFREAEALVARLEAALDA